MKILVLTITGYLFGCLIAFLNMQLVNWLNKVDSGDLMHVKRQHQIVLSAFSWVVPIYFLYRISVLARGAAKVKRTGDCELLNYTIENYWVKVIQDPLFDDVGFLPLKNSPTCHKYYKTNECPECPISKAGFACQAPNSLYKKYREQREIVINSRGGLDRKDALMVEAERVNAAIRCAKIFESVMWEIGGKNG